MLLATEQDFPTNNNFIGDDLDFFENSAGGGGEANPFQLHQQHGDVDLLNSSLQEDIIFEDEEMIQHSKGMVFNVAFQRLYNVHNAGTTSYER